MPKQPPHTPLVTVSEKVETPDIPITSVVSTDAQGWVAATKVARQVSRQSMVISDTRRGFEVLLKDSEGGSGVRRRVELSDIDP